MESKKFESFLLSLNLIATRRITRFAIHICLRHNQSRVYRHYKITAAWLIHALRELGTYQPRSSTTTAINLLSSFSYLDATSFATSQHYQSKWRIAPDPTSGLKTAVPNLKLKKLQNLNVEWAFCQTFVVCPCRAAGRRRAWAGGMQMPRESVVRGCQCECLVPLAALERPTSPPVTVVFRSASN